MTEIQITPNAVDFEVGFDLMITCLGYETRATYVAERYSETSERRVALAFPERQLLSFNRNLEFYTANEFEIIEFHAEEFERKLQQLIEGCVPKSSNELRVLVDISSMSRPMIANVVVSLSKVVGDGTIAVVFTYCPAIFTKPPNVGQPVTVSQPVVPELAGWSIQPERPVAAIVGLGFEFDQALGAIEYLEPAIAWAFLPSGEDRKFDEAVSEANSDLLTSLNPDQLVYYNVADTYKCFVELEALTYGLMDSMRPIIVPFGPKLFALLAFLVGVIHAPNVAVWRVSGDQVVIPEDRVASGKIVALGTVFLAKDKRPV